MKSVSERHQVPEQDRVYTMAFYIQGLMAIITEWLKGDCADPIEHVIGVMRRCAMPLQENGEKK